MYLLVAAILAGAGWFVWKRLKKHDPRLGKAFWRNSFVVVLAYLLFLLVGGFVTRIMVGFNTGALADLLLVGFYIAWGLYGGLWLARLLPMSRGRPGWADQRHRWLDVVGGAAIIGFAVAARLV